MRGKRKRRRGPCGRVRMEEGEGGEWGIGVTVGSVEQPAMAPDHRVWVAPLPHKQGRAAAMGDAGERG
jgi:hypothetical protein